MKKIVQISLFTLTAIGLLILTGFIVVNNKTAEVADVKINIYRNAEVGFLNISEIMSVVNNIDSLPHQRAGQNITADRQACIQLLKINEIDTDVIEEALAINPYIDRVDSYLTIDGKILINIKEKEPIIRIYDKGGKGFYIDNKGNIFPISRQYAPRVLITNGYINETVTDFNSNITDSVYDESVFREVFLLTQLINNNSLLKAQINQIYVNSKGEYDLIPELGDHIIQFGNITDAPIKLKNLNAYYQKYLKTSNWDSYKIINLTYKDQIVCTKK